MRFLLHITAVMLLLGSCGTATRRQEVQPVRPQLVTVKDTVTQLIVDSVVLEDFYRREKRLTDQLATAMALLRDYAAQEKELQDSITLLTGEWEQLVLDLEISLLLLRDSMANYQYASDIVPVAQAVEERDSTVQQLEAKARWLAAQPRRLFIIGTDDSADEIEVTNACSHDNYLLIALSSRNELTSVLLNGSEPMATEGKIFAYTAPGTRNVQIEVATAAGRHYNIRTTIKKLQ